MASRLPSEDNTDFFPTPPWGTRALIERVLRPRGLATLGAVWEPACGQGDMARPLLEYTNLVDASDVVDRGYGRRADFLWPSTAPEFPIDWVITNPPFVLAMEFVEKALFVASTGVAMLCRVPFLEGVERYQRLYSRRPLALYAPFVERLPMVKGRLDAKASTATAYAWFVWRKDHGDADTITHLIPPCRAQLERRGDYQ